MNRAVLFDLGNTLVRYYELKDFPEILERSIAEVSSYLRSMGDEEIEEGLANRVAAENHEERHHAVRPLEERLARIFGNNRSQEVMPEMCRRFMRPIFALSHLYDDVLPALDALRSRGYRVGIISNTPWGSPADLWHKELDRLGLSAGIDAAIFCRDIGWRKPAPEIFRHALDILSLPPSHCVFIGDDPRWDIAGPHAIGMEAILIDRRESRETGTTPDLDTRSGTIGTLTELLELL